VWGVSIAFSALTALRGSGPCRVPASYVTDTVLIVGGFSVAVANEQYTYEYYREIQCEIIEICRIRKFIVVATMCFNFMD
jgi:hypothetical protein